MGGRFCLPPTLHKEKEMKRIILLMFVVLFFAGTAYSAEMIYSEDFENVHNNDIGKVFFTSHSDDPPDQYVAITTNDPHGGSKCLRGNVYDGHIDDITGLPGELSPKLNIGGNTGSPLWGSYHNFRNQHDKELYFSWWMRWDEGANFTRNGGNPGAYKLMYISSTGGVVQSYNNRYNHKATFYSNYMDEGQNVSYLPLINDGQWHHYEVYIKYESSYGANDAVWEFWEDGVKAWEKTDAHFLASATGKIQNIHFIHYTFGAEGSSGWQIDDIEIWDGKPDEQPPINYSGSISAEADSYEYVKSTDPDNPTYAKLDLYYDNGETSIDNLRISIDAIKNSSGAIRKDLKVKHYDVGSYEGLDVYNVQLNAQAASPGNYTLRINAEKDGEPVCDPALIDILIRNP